jgi:hypothetical protein
VQYLGLEPGDTSVHAQGVFMAPPGNPVVANGEILFDVAWGVKEDRILPVMGSNTADWT